MLEPRDADVSRRTFLGRMGAAAALGAGASLWLPVGLRAAAREEASTAPAKGDSETAVKALYETLTAEQKAAVHFPFDHELRKKVANNWHIVDEKQYTIGGGFYTSDQQELIRQVLRGLTTEDGYARFQKQMQDDAGGFGNYTCALFGSPGEPGGKFEMVISGRHSTLRADGDSVENAAFGGPIFYGHAVEFNEKPDHPGNVWWHQSRLANKVYQALDGKQQERALSRYCPDDDPAAIELRKAGEEIPGLPGSELSADQKELLRTTLEGLMSMFRESDVKEVMTSVEKGGGIDALRMSFFREGDIGGDGVWDRWKIEGPTFAWFFRGSPHAHVWLNVVNPAGETSKAVSV